MKTYLAAVVGLLVMSSTATPTFAADPIDVDELIEEASQANAETSQIDQTSTMPVEIISGWYLRGDISGNFASSARLFGNANDHNRFGQASFADTIGFAAGLGYQITDNLRTDVTIGYNNRNANSYSEQNGSCFGGVGGQCKLHDETAVSTWEMMANAYVDLPTEYGFTPYLGIGAGFARVAYKTGSRNSVCVIGGANADCGTSLTAGEVNWRPAYSLMAGVSIPITDYVMLDVGYKFTDIKDGAAVTTTTGTRRDRGISSHEVKAGLRVNSW